MHFTLPNNVFSPFTGGSGPNTTEVLGGSMGGWSDWNPLPALSPIPPSTGPMRAASARPLPPVNGEKTFVGKAP